MDILFNNFLVRKYIDSLLVELGKGVVVKLHEFRIVSSEKRVLIVLELAGESELLTINIDGYCIEEGGTLFINSLTTSKAWISVVLNTFLTAKDNRIKLPDSNLSTVLQKLV